jgi:Predicted ATPase
MRDNEERIIGRCIGETSPLALTFISKKTPKVGEYVVLEYGGTKVLGMIETLSGCSTSITEKIYNPETVEKIREIEGEDHYIRGSIKILGDVETLRIPRVPPGPGIKIRIADEDTLKKVFSGGKDELKIGDLITQEGVAVELDVNKMVTRHLAILAMTGAGKSNTVAVITDGILKFKGSVLIFDMHSEYVDAEFDGGTNVIEPHINPLYLSLPEFAKLANIPGDAYVQERYFRMAYGEIRNSVRRGNLSNKEFFNSIQEKLDEFLEMEDYKGDKKPIVAVKNKLDDLIERYRNILSLNAPDLVEEIKLSAANVIDLGSVDEDAADVIVSHTLSNLLKKIKRGDLSFPVFVVLEEAHILAPKSRLTLSKYWIGRIAREGRKFGIGLCMVSQRPKSLDPESLSQANNMIILRLIEPTDQRHVQEASESLSEDLLKQLPSLNIGEAIVLGPMTRVPALVKIDEFKGKLSGGDINIVERWRRLKEEDERELEEQEKEISEFMEY